MKRKAKKPASAQGCRGRYSLPLRRILTALCAVCFALTAQAQSSNMDQGANGQLSSPTTVTWQNGNLNSNNSHYIEGQSVPYRLVMSNLPVGTPVTVTMNFDITHGAKYAIDFITGYNWLQPHNFANHTTPEAIDPLAGTGISGTPDYLRPSDPNYLSGNLAVPGASNALASFQSINGYNSSGTPVIAANNQNSMSLWGGTFDQVYGVTYSYSSSVLVLNNVNQSVSFTFKFTPTSADAVLAWGGHIARRQDWGTSPVQSAGGISGSPYHMRRESWSLGNIGNTDMQMQIALSAAICPSDLNPAVSICTNSGGVPIQCPNIVCMGTTLYYSIPTESGADTYSWSVTPSTGVTISPNATSQSVAITYANAGSYTVNVSLSNASGIATICSVPVTISPGPTCSITGVDSICTGSTTTFSAPAGMSSYSWTGPGGFTASTQSTGSISTAGTYSVTITDANGCTSTCSRALVVNSLPSAPSTVGASRCGPGVVTLNASGCTGGTLKWYNAASGGTLVNTGATYAPNLSATTSFWVSCTSAAGCEGPRTQVTDTINAVPTAPATIGASRCGPGVVTLSASGCTGGTLKWYDAASGGNLVNTGATYAPNLSATTSFWVSCTSAAGCEGPRTQITDTINAIPSAPSTVGASRCGPGVVTLSASGCTGGTLKWYDAASGGNLVNTGATYAPNLSATTSFWVSCTSAAGCEGPRTQVTDTINAVPTAPATVGASRCGPGVVTLSASGCTGGTLKWYNAASGGTLVNTGATYAPNLSVTTSFWVSCTNAAGCEGPRTQVTDTINASPSAPATIGASRCGPGVVTLNASGCTGGTLKWYDAASGGTLVNTGATYAPNLSATTSFWVSCTSAAGCEGPRTQVTDTINAIPTAPATVGASRCGPGVVTLNSSGCTGGTLKWYDAVSGGNLVNTGATYAPNLSATTSFWVSCTSAAGCEGPRTQVTDTINAIPTAPATVGASRCGPGVVTLSASGCTGGTLKWYNAASGGTLVNTGATYAPNLSATTSFWVSCTSAAGCEGPRTQVTDTINAVPTAPSTVGASRCGPGVVTLSASGCTGGTLKWYDAASGGNLVNTGATYAPNLSATTSFWVSCTSAVGCEGPRTQVTDTINAVPTAPATVGASRCGPGVVTLNASGCTGGTLKWYDAASGGNLVNTGATYAPNLSATTSFWVSCTSAAGCEGPRTQVTDTINAVPTAPATVGASRCGPGVVTLSASGCTGGTLKWYDAASGGNLVNTGATYAPNLSATTSFWVSCTSAAGCEGPRTQVTDTINAVPSAPATTGASRCGPGVVTLSASGCTGGTLKWYNAASGGTLVNTGATYAPNLSTTTSFWVSCTSAAGCEGPRTQVTDTINAVPSAPATIGASRCGPGVVTLNASGCTGGILKWYDAASGGNLVNTGATYAPNLSTTTSFWVSCTSAAGCEGPRTQITDTINAIPTAPSTVGASRCGPGVVTLNASGCTGGTLKWYDAASGGNLVNTGATYAPNLSATTSFWVSCTSAAGCEGPRAQVTDTINAIPVVSANDTDVCTGNTVILTGSPAGGIWSSAQNGVISGNIFNAAGLAAGPYTVTYTFTDANGCSNSDDAIVTVKNCGQTYCTYTQGYFGNKNGNSCDGDTTWPNPVSLINHLLSTNLVIGNGGKSVLIPIGAGAIVNSVMPGNSTPNGLTYNGQCTISTAAGSCFKTNYLNGQGRINNVLLSQTITLGLNVRMQNGALLNVPVQQGYLVTQRTTGCGTPGSTTVPCSVDSFSLQQFFMNANVVDYLTNFGGNTATVANLLQLANDVLGGALTPGQAGANGNIVPSYSDVNAAVDAINRGFDKCRFFVGYNAPLCPPSIVLLPKMAQQGSNIVSIGAFSIYPNPGQGSFVISSENGMEKTDVVITDMTGKTIGMTSSINGSKMMVKINHPLPGIYIIHITDHTGVYRSKIIVQ